jgi:hypothetical protein
MQKIDPIGEKEIVVALESAQLFQELCVVPDMEILGKFLVVSIVGADVLKGGHFQ